MKKQLFAWILVFLSAAGAVSCSQDEPAPEVLDYAEPTYKAPTRSTEAVIALAEAAVSQEATKGRAQRTVSSKNAVRPIVSHKSRTEADTLLYVVQYDDNQGFAVISAPECVEPVIAVIDDGTYDSYETMTNEPFQAFMADAQQYAAARSGLGFTFPTNPIIPNPIKPTKLFKFDTIRPTPRVDPTVKVAWNQAWPENIFAPNRVAGCTPVAIAQILSVFELPTYMSYTFSNRDINNENIDWKDIKKHSRSIIGYTPSEDEINNHLLHCQTTPEHHRTLGRMIRQFGQMASSVYTYDRGTQTPVGNELPVLKSFLPHQKFIQGTSATKLFDVLVGETAPVAFVGGQASSGNGIHIGHAWVADGTWSIGTLVKEYHYDSIVGAYYLAYTYGENMRYIHYNWGWGGNCNGYFLESIGNPKDGYQYDFYNGKEDYNYSTSSLYYIYIY